MSNKARTANATTSTILDRARKENALVLLPLAPLICFRLQGSSTKYTKEAGKVHNARARHLENE